MELNKGARGAFVVCCFSFCLTLGFTVADSGLSCGQKMPAGCKVYTTNEDCNRRYAELNRVTAGVTPWPGPVDKLHVQPFRPASITSGATSLTRQTGVRVSWTLPRDKLHVFQGVKLTVTALDDASQSTLCHLLDLSAVTNCTQSVMSYAMTLPSLPDVYNWHVQLESLPSPAPDVNWRHGVASVFVTTDRLFAEGSPLTSCSIAVLVSLGSPTSALNVTVGHVITTDTPAASYDVILYEYEDRECCHFCDCLSQVDMNTITSPSEVTSFRGIVPGWYRVWVQPAGQPEQVCGRSPLLTIEENKAFNAPKPTVNEADNKADVVAAIAETSDYRSSDQRVSSPPHSAVSKDTSSGVDYAGDEVGDDGYDWKLACGIIAAVLAVVVVTVALLALLRRRQLACWSRQTKGYSVSASRCHDGGVINMHAVSPSSTHHTNHTHTHTPNNVAVLLLSLSDRAHHVRAIDALAVYLQAFCACDVTYFRWHDADDIRQQGGPEEWTARQMNEGAACVVFVRGTEDETPDDAAGQSTAGARRAAAAALGHVDDPGAPARRRWFNVTLCSSAAASAGDVRASRTRTRGRSPRSETRAEGTVSSSSPSSSNERRTGKPRSAHPPRENLNGACRLDMAPWGRLDPINNNNNNNDNGADRGAGPDVPRPRYAPPKSMAETRRSCYRLMADFSQLLADLHELPNSPAAFRERDLPLSAERSDTPEGRRLLAAVTSAASPRPREHGSGGVVVEEDDRSVTGAVFGGGGYCYCSSYYHRRCDGSNKGSGEERKRGGGGNCSFNHDEGRRSCGPGETMPVSETDTGRRPGHGKGRRTERGLRRESGVDGILGRETKEGERAKQADSGFDEEPGWSFVPPDGLSAVVDTDVSSLGSGFRAIDARYELYAQTEDSASRADCYTLGERCV